MGNSQWINDFGRMALRPVSALAHKPVSPFGIVHFDMLSVNFGSLQELRTSFDLTILSKDLSA